MDAGGNGLNYAQRGKPVVKRLRLLQKEAKWTLGDLNPRPSGCKPDALPTELSAPRSRGGETLSLLSVHLSTAEESDAVNGCITVRANADAGEQGTPTNRFEFCDVLLSSCVEVTEIPSPSIHWRERATSKPLFKSLGFETRHGHVNWFTTSKSRCSYSASQ